MDPKRATTKTIILSFCSIPGVEDDVLIIVLSTFSQYNSYTEGTQCNIANATNGLNGTPELVAPMGPMLLEGSVLFA